NSTAPDGLAISPSLNIVTESAQVPVQHAVIDRRALLLCLLAVILGLAAGIIAQVLIALIALITNLAFFGRWSFADVSPGGAVGSLGVFIVAIPVIGALVVG